jgi:hypothetical protein
MDAVFKGNYGVKKVLRDESENYYSKNNRIVLTANKPSDPSEDEENDENVDEKIMDP